MIDPDTSDAVALSSPWLYVKSNAQEGVIRFIDITSLVAVARERGTPIVITALSLDGYGHHEYVGEYDIRIRNIETDDVQKQALRTLLANDGWSVSEEGPQPGALHTGAAAHFHIERHVDRTLPKWPTSHPA